MKAVWNNQVVAEADKADLVYIEGNWYFPPDSLRKSFFHKSHLHTLCYWKGLASYYNIGDDSRTSKRAAWYYPKPTRLSKKIVHKDFANYVAFWGDIEVTN